MYFPFLKNAKERLTRLGAVVFSERHISKSKPCIFGGLFSAMDWYTFGMRVSISCCRMVYVNLTENNLQCTCFLWRDVSFCVT